jgi:prohibitin 2
MNSLYNVEGGHRAIVFNRIQGIKDKVWASAGAPPVLPASPIFYPCRMCGLVW